jgi:hypothetical protein
VIGGPLQRLDDEVGDDAPVIGVHARPIGVEDAGDPDLEAMLAEIVEEQGLGAALAFVVAGARPDRVDIAAIALGLRMQGRVAIDLGGRGLKDPGLEALGEAQHVDRADDAGLGGLHRIELIVDRRGRAGEVVDLVDLDKQRMGDVVAHRLEMRHPQQRGEIVLAAGEVVVDAQHVVALGNEALAQMRAEKSGAAGDQNALSDDAHEWILLGRIRRGSLALAGAACEEGGPASDGSLEPSDEHPQRGVERRPA